MPQTLYIRDERFKAHGAAVAFNDSPSQWITKDHLPGFWSEIAPHVDAVCAYNGAFDHQITAHHYCAKRFFLLDPMLMAIAVLSFKHPDLSVSLASVAKHLFPDDPNAQKFDGFIHQTKGLVDLPPHLERPTADYAIRDNNVCRRIFRTLVSEIVPTELEAIDVTLAMQVYPRLHIDTALAQQIHTEEVARKDEDSEMWGVSRETLRSDQQFAALLSGLGVEPPTKISGRTGEVAFAFAKSDIEFKALLHHENPVVADLVALRLGERAAQLEKRAAMFAKLPSPCPVPLAYHRAHTGRHGGQEFNMQNLGKKGGIRHCLVAPNGHSFLVTDLGQIELRMNAWFCREQWLLDALADGEDVYCHLASDVYGKKITKADEHERYVGKQGELSCGYQSGATKFYNTMLGHGVKITEEEAQRAVHVYRQRHPNIKGMWKWLQDYILPLMVSGGEHEYMGCTFRKHSVQLPSGRFLHYPDLHVDDLGEFKYRVNKKKNYGKEWKKIYGGALLENLIQAMSRDVFMYQVIQINRAGIPPVMLVHDEFVTLVEDNQKEQAARVVEHYMTIAPHWCSDVPLKVESSFGKTYGEAK